ncbi:MAG: hypothetical protein M1819_004978 [Sarea resinae]|nr:MAG: hypothetical protein M1819_004978 [Sarea resinae]
MPTTRTSISSAAPSSTPSSPLLSPSALYAASLRDRPPTARSTSPVELERRDPRKKMMTMQLTEAEFEKLPLAVRRKQFSSLERLRMAQNSTRPQTHSGMLHRKANCSLSGPISFRSHSEKGRGPGSTSLRKIKKLKSGKEEFLVTQADAQWFLRLPEKIRRRHFTREEQVLLAGHCESVILDATDEAIHKAGVQATRSTNSVAGRSREKSCADETRDSTDVGSPGISKTMEESFRWMEDDDLDLRLRLEDYHEHVAHMATPESQPDVRSRRPSLRRKISRNSLAAFGRSPTSSSTQMQPPQSEGLHDPRKLRGSMIAPPRHKAKGSVSSIEPGAKHYQDPEARLRLRVYLGSPQKFDEVVEFGFPSTETESRGPGESGRHKLGGRLSSNDTQTFLHNDQVSFLEDGDDASVAETDFPATPSDHDTVFRSPHRLPSSNVSSTDSSGLPRFLPKTKPTDSYAQALAGNREMTLRMTLTRPDLRADDSDLYAWQGKPNNDLLALEDLPPLTEEGQGVATPFANSSPWAHRRDGSMVKKLWRRVKPGQS